MDKSECKDPVLNRITAALEAMDFEIYAVYEDDIGHATDAIHIDPETMNLKSLQKLIRLIGMYNFSFADEPKQQIILRPHNYGDWESFLSLEPHDDCRPKKLEPFAEFLEKMLSAI